jgi:hypothetical protein
MLRDMDEKVGIRELKDIDYRTDSPETNRLDVIL